MIRQLWPGRTFGTMMEEGPPGEMDSLNAFAKESEAETASCERGSCLSRKRGGRRERLFRDVKSKNTGGHGNLFTVIGPDVDSCREIVLQAIRAVEMCPGWGKRQGLASQGPRVEAPSIGGGAPAGQPAARDATAAGCIGGGAPAGQLAKCNCPARAAQDIDNCPETDTDAGFSSDVPDDENAPRPSRWMDVPDTSGETYWPSLLKGILTSWLSGWFAALSGQEGFPHMPAAALPDAMPKQRPPPPAAQAAGVGDHREWRRRIDFSPALDYRVSIAKAGPAGDHVARLGDMAMGNWKLERLLYCSGAAGAFLRSLLPLRAAIFTTPSKHDDQLKQTLTILCSLIDGIRPASSSAFPKRPSCQPASRQPANQLTGRRPTHQSTRQPF